MTLNDLLLLGILAMNVSLQMANAADMTFHGTLIEPPPCTINDGNKVEVNFGENVGINKVDGVNYRQLVNYQITCDSTGAGGGTPTLSLIGNTSAFDQNALLTNQDNLGIRIYSDDRPFSPGSKLNIDFTNPPRLEAVPVKNVGTALTEGDFEAWATLQADYQ